VPSGVIAATAALSSYAMALRVGEQTSSAQSAATTTLFIVAIAVLLQAARPLNPLRLGIVVSMVVAFIGVLAIPWLSDFFALSLGPERYAAVAVGFGLAGALLVWVATIVTDRWRRA
jgi:cation-transporting ATPase E